MVRKLLLLTLLSTISFAVFAQPQPCAPGEPPAEDCNTACINCNFTGSGGSTASFSGGSAPGFCGTLHNDQWVGFIAGGPVATFTATPAGCQTGDGIQIALYSDCGSGPVDCNGGCTGCGTTPLQLVNVPLVIGQTYFMVVDGYIGDICGFSVSVSPVSAVQAPPVGPIRPLQGPKKMCPGGSGVYTIPAAVSGVETFIWNAPPGSTINGNPPPYTVDASNGYTVTVTFGNSGGAVSVQGINACRVGGVQSINVNVAPIPPNTLAKETVCLNQMPYYLPWGEEIPPRPAGNYTFQTTLVTPYGCDSVVIQPLRIAPSYSIGPIIRYVCADNPKINICGTEYTGPNSNIEHNCKTFLDCDSIIKINLQVLNPIADIVTTGNTTLSCSNKKITLRSLASPNPSVKNWRVLTGSTLGPIIGSGDTLAVTLPGKYVLTTTMTVQSVTCVKLDTFEIKGNTTPPTVSASANGSIGCGGNQVTLSTTNNATTPTFTWAGPNSFSSSSATPQVTVSGLYTVTIVNSTNGCTSTATVNVQGNTTLPSASTTVSGPITCANQATGIGITSTTNAATPVYQWSGPSGFTSTSANPTVLNPGVYTVTITNQFNNCSSTATAVVDLDKAPPAAAASAAGTITCPTPAVTLTATPATGVTYNWSGPNSASGTAATLSATLAGNYIVTVTSNSNGCTATATAAVSGNTTPPQLAAAGGTVSCAVQSINLTGSSITPNVTYAWTGPNGFTSSSATPSVTFAGTYTLAVTGPNNCIATTTATVLGDFVAPNASAAGGVITCGSTSAAITGNSTTANSTFSWTGPGNFTSTNQNAVATLPGDYILTVKGPNGCTSTATAVVTPDSQVPAITANGGTLNCTVQQIQLSASATLNASIDWTGPNGFISSSPTPTVTEAGTYTIVAINPNNGCSAEAQITVALDNVPPPVAVVGGTVSCKTPTIALNATTTSTTVATWGWTGPSGYLSNAQNPNDVTAPGAYLLTATGANGCATTATATVLEDKAPPTVGTTGGTLTCSLTTLNINTSTSTPSTYSWTGPNTFASTQQNPAVTEPGTYTVVAKADNNGCTSTSSVTVLQDIAKPDASAKGDTVTCAIPTVTIAANSITTGVTYAWDGPGGFTSALQSPTTSIAGPYVVTVTAQNGCKSTATATVAENKANPSATNATPEVLTCAKQTITIDATLSTPQSSVKSVAWTGPTGFSASTEDPAVTQPGIYKLLVTANNGCTGTLDVNVTQNITPPDATAFGGTVDCVVDSLKLDGASTTQAATFSWTGPGGFTASIEDPIARNLGTYTLTVQGPNGCTSTATAVLNANVALPDVSVLSTNNLDCDDLTTTLQASSQTTGVSYAWSGPALLSPTTAQAPLANKPGTYVVAVKAPNGCVSRDTVTVSQDIVKPDVVTVGNTITCTNPTVAISATSQAPGATFLWEGPGNFRADSSVTAVSKDGVYVLTVTGANACTSTASATVLSDTKSPSLSNATPEILTCAKQTIVIDATISAPTSPISTLAWSGPSSFMHAGEDPSVTEPGPYKLIATSANGCTEELTVVVSQDIAQPEVTADGGTLTCSITEIALQGASSTTGATYEWTGPAGEVFNVATPLVSTVGVWTLKVTGPNGCSKTATANVGEDVALPGAAAVSANNLDCDDLTSKLLATSPTTGVNYVWSGPGLSATNIFDPVANQPGDYTVTVTGANGCKSTATLTITQDITAPDASATGNTITCATPQPVINAASTTTGVTYQWAGPGGFNSTSASPSVSLSGTYTVTVKGTNACTSTATALVDRDAAIPDIQAATPQVLTCDSTNSRVSVDITVLPTITVQSIAWTGPNGFTSDQRNFTVSTPGKYNLTVVTSNGCNAKAEVTVSQNIAQPGATAAAGTLTCAMPSFTLQGSSPTTNVGWSWSGPNNFTSTSQNPTVTTAGMYTVTVRDLGNGCTSTSTAELKADVNAPVATAAVTDTLTCKRGSVNLTATSSMAGKFRWAGPGGFSSAAPNPSTTTAGTYTVTVTADLNGCTDVKTVDVAENKTLPDVATKGDTVSCNRPQVPVSATSQAPGAYYKWAGPTNFSASTSAPSVTEAGTYTVTVTGYNGCTSTATALVASDKEKPLLSGNATDILTCKNLTVGILASVASVSPVQTIAWSGPASYTSSVEDPSDIKAPGQYLLTVTPKNGCTSTTTVTVNQNIVAPQNPTATGGQLDCNKPSIKLGAGTSTQNVSYTWAGPGGITLNGQTPDVNNPGTYTVTITNQANDCTSTATALVTQDPSLPNISAKTDTLTCARKTVVLDANSTTAGVTYAWTGPNGFSNATQDPIVDRPGAYQVVVTGTNGCKSTFDLNVAQDIAPPTLEAKGDTITCATNSGTLSSITTTPNVSYAWTGPNNFSATVANPTVTVVGDYTVVLTARNGCQSTATVRVSPDQSAPQVDVKGGTISCAVKQINLDAKEKSNKNVRWNWTGPNGFTSAIANPQVTLPGSYTLVTTNIDNGCTVTSNAQVADDTKGPQVATNTPRELNCSVTEVNISASVPVSGTYTYQWSTVGGVISSGQQSALAKATAAAKYTVVVTDTRNGCSTVADVTVKADPAKPTALGSTKHDVRCFGQDNGAFIIDSISGGTPPILFSIDGGPFTGSRVFTALKPGVHKIQLEDALGCELDTTFTITEPDELTVNLGRDTTIFLGDEILVSLDDVVNDPARVVGVTVSPAEFTASIDSIIKPLRSLRYKLTVSDASGCKASDDRMIIVDRSRHIFIPSAFNPESNSGNELLVIQGGKDVERIKSVRIYDRWGNQVHEYFDFLPGDPASGWNGTQAGKKLSPAVFVLMTEVLFIDGETVQYTQDVTLTR